MKPSEMNQRELSIRRQELRRKTIKTEAECIEFDIVTEELERARAIERAHPTCRPGSGVVELDPDVGAGLIIRLCEENLSRLYPQWEQAKAREAANSKQKAVPDAFAPQPVKIMLQGRQL